MNFIYKGSKAEEVNEVLSCIVDAFVHNLSPNLKGLYLHGSLAMGCFRPWSSDFDLLAVVFKPLERETKLKLVHDIMGIAEGGCGFRNVEFSIVTAAEAARAEHPIQYLLHYSFSWHQAYKDGKAELVIEGGVDEDLAAHFMVTRKRGVALYGVPVDEAIGPVSREDYLNAVWYDIASSEADAQKKPFYTILNLCRTLMFLETGRVGSKLEGGQWAEELPGFVPYKLLIETAIGEYTTGVAGSYDSELLTEFAREMLQRCNELR